MYPRTQLLKVLRMAPPVALRFLVNFLIVVRRKLCTLHAANAYRTLRKKAKIQPKPFQGIHCVSHLIIVAFETCIVCTHEIKDWKRWSLMAISARLRFNDQRSICAERRVVVH